MCRLANFMSAEEWRVWAVLQMAITGSGALPLPHAYAALGAPLGLAAGGADVGSGRFPPVT